MNDFSSEIVTKKMLGISRMMFEEASTHGAEVSPHVLFLQSNDEPHIHFPATLGNDDEKTKFAFMIREAARFLKPLGIIFVTECWFSTTTDMTTAISERSDRIEGLSVQIETVDEVEVYVYLAKILNVEGKSRTLGDFNKSSARGGLFGCGFLPDERFGKSGDA